ncbi:hypothetical protein, partial [Salmonella sp. s55004]|uniref:hypothetical protein n=1 Tax=Salmonella sp. s55004 TaxID=3159675 RepID=UPI00397EB3B8
MYTQLNTIKLVFMIIPKPPNTYVTISRHMQDSALKLVEIPIIGEIMFHNALLSALQEVRILLVQLRGQRRVASLVAAMILFIIV